jgi:hypothetical protein
MISALTFNGINYLSGGSAKQFVSMEASWENNFRPGFFPGSGAQDGYQIQGRFEWGDRVFAVQFVVRVQAGSTEYANLINLTTGTATFTMTRDANNSFTMLIQKMGFNVAELGNTDGIVTLQITGVQLYDPTNGMVTMTDHHAANRASANRRLEWKPKRKRASTRRSRFVVPILSGGEKSCEVRFPSDEEWCAWARAQRTVRHFLGRGKSQSEDVDLPKINAELFAKIRTDKDGPEFDDAEAGMVIGRIERCAVANVEREGINYRIEMKVPGARVVHVLRMPTAKEMQDHERASTSVVAARRSVETRAFLEPSGALYDKLHISHDGYAGAVPIVHKSAAVSEVIAQLAIEATKTRNSRARRLAGRAGRSIPDPVGAAPGRAVRA